MELLTNKIFLSLFFSLAVVQLIKVGIRLYKKEFRFWDLFATGGMPSSHSALMFTLVVSVYLVDGLSTAFFVSLVMLGIVLRDAVGVRRTTGEEGKMLVKIAKKLKMDASHLHIAMGHTPLQVFVGSLLGIVITLIVFFVF